MSSETGNPSDVPAIILTGPTIEAMPRERREEVAESLTTLLDVDAWVIHEPEPHIEETPSTPPLTPYSLLIPQPWTDGEQRRGMVRQALPELEGTHEGQLLLTGLESLFVRPISAQYTGENPDISGMVAYHYTDDRGIIKPEGVTFEDPQKIVDRPNMLRVLNGVGSVTAPILAQFIDAAGRPPQQFDTSEE
ncbi:MAG TPA: hypothetical protein VHT70_00635 [Candidatus Saccharimonadales bacterium]|jgi:hypothetical protein|nr:hypothetical protein [Candidatus Saccharimonadales bacterium]